MRKIAQAHAKKMDLRVEFHGGFAAVEVRLTSKDGTFETIFLDWERAASVQQALALILGGQVAGIVVEGWNKP